MTGDIGRFYFWSKSITRNATLNSFGEVEKLSLFYFEEVMRQRQKDKLK